MIIHPKSLLTAILLLGSGAGNVLAQGNYQENALFHPNSHTLLAEAKGRVMIYDGLTNDTVEQAMDDQFDRIDNMMFVRTRHVQEDGSVEEDDDGC